MAWRKKGKTLNHCDRESTARGDFFPVRLGAFFSLFCMLRYFISFSLLSSERPSYDHFLAILYHRLLLPHFIQSFQKRRYWPTWNRFRPATTVVRDSRWCFPYHSVTTGPGWWWREKKKKKSEVLSTRQQPSHQSIARVAFACAVLCLLDLGTIVSWLRNAQSARERAVLNRTFHQHPEYDPVVSIDNGWQICYDPYSGSGRRGS